MSNLLAPDFPLRTSSRPDDAQLSLVKLLFPVSKFPKSDKVKDYCHPRHNKIPGLSGTISRTFQAMYDFFKFKDIPGFSRTVETLLVLNLNAYRR